MCVLGKPIFLEPILIDEAFDLCELEMEKHLFAYFRSNILRFYTLVSWDIPVKKNPCPTTENH